MKVSALIGRILFSLIFILGGLGHFAPQTLAFAQSKGVPLAELIVPASGILAMLGGLSVAVGLRARWGALALVAFLVPVTVSMHAFWTVTDPAARHLEVTIFMKNVALLGGALFISYAGAGAYSLDARRGRRRGALASAAA